MPGGKVARAEGGYRLTGRWTFSSGSSHCGWAILGALIPPANPPGPPEFRLFLVPRADYRIIENWDVIGLRATGSNDIETIEAFVPEHRTYRPDAGLLPLQDPALPELYRMPWLYVFTSMISNLSIGTARGAVKAFTEIARPRLANPATPAPREAQALARAHSELDMFDLMEQRNFGKFQHYIKSGEAMPLAEALLYRAQLTSMVRRIFALVDELMLLAGSKGFRDGSRLGQIWLDLGVARAHVGNDPFATFNQLTGELIAEPS
jgi:3-hydroxy-9,10-secoandrosta-1,3,5(10)-triene-9,17-dione monooxygenase